MKRILLAGLICFGTFTSPLLAPPAIAQTQFESIQDMANWMQEITTIQVDLSNLFSADAMTEMYSILNTGDLDDMRRLGQQFESERQAVLARASHQIKAISPPEKWNFDNARFSKQETQIFQAAKKQYSSLNETYKLFDTLTETLSDILNNPEDFDDEALDELFAVQQQASIRLVELENEQIDGYLVAIPKDNPNHQFQKVVKQFNLASIPELKISILDNELDLRRAYAEDMKSELKTIGPLIQSGRKNMQTQLKQFRVLISRPGLSQADKNSLELVIGLYESFDDSFEVESKLLDALESSYELYITDKSDEEIEPFIDDNDLTYFSLIENRTELVQYRLSLLQ